MVTHAIRASDSTPVTPDTLTREERCALASGGQKFRCDKCNFPMVFVNTTSIREAHFRHIGEDYPKSCPNAHVTGVEGGWLREQDDSLFVRRWRKGYGIAYDMTQSSSFTFIKDDICIRVVDNIRPPPLNIIDWVFILSGIRRDISIYWMDDSNALVYTRTKAEISDIAERGGVAILDSGSDTLLLLSGSLLTPSNAYKLCTNMGRSTTYLADQCFFAKAISYSSVVEKYMPDGYNADVRPKHARAQDGKAYKTYRFLIHNEHRHCLRRMDRNVMCNICKQKRYPFISYVCIPCGFDCCVQCGTAGRPTTETGYQSSLVTAKTERTILEAERTAKMEAEWAAAKERTAKIAAERAAAEEKAAQERAHKLAAERDARIAAEKKAAEEKALKDKIAATKLAAAIRESKRAAAVAKLGKDQHAITSFFPAKPGNSSTEPKR